MEPTGHTQAQSLQNFAIFARSDMSANFGKFLSLVSGGSQLTRPYISVTVRHCTQDFK